MNLTEDTTGNLLDYLSCEDIINLKKSEAIDYLSDVKLRELLSKKFLNKMMKQYADEEYKEQDIDFDTKLNSMISRFCFSSVLSEFAYDIDLSSEQIFKMISILTIEQLEKVNNHLTKSGSKGWY
jgi:hypothetical protein